MRRKEKEYKMRESFNCLVEEKMKQKKTKIFLNSYLIGERK